MRTLRFLLQKEFKQIFRNKALLPLIFVAPILQLLILPLAADYEIRHVRISIVDHDHSTISQQLVSKITASGYFELEDYSNSFPVALNQVEQDRADLILEIPQGFERNLTPIQRIDAILFRVNKRESTEWFSVEDLKQTITDEKILPNFTVTEEYLYEVLEQLADDGYLKRNPQNKPLDILKSSYYTTNRGKLFQGFILISTNDLIFHFLYIERLFRLIQPRAQASKLYNLHYVK